MTGSTHQPPLRCLRRQQPAKRRAQAVRSGRPHSLFSAALCSGWTPGLFAPCPLSRFPNVWKSALGSLPTPGNLLRMRSHPVRASVSELADLHPGRVSSVVFAALRKLHSPKPIASNTPPKAARQFAPNVCLRCKRRGHLPCRRKDLLCALSILTPGTAPADTGWPLLGSGRWPSADLTRQSGFFGFATKETSSANRKSHFAVASLPSRIFRSLFAVCDPPCRVPSSHYRGLFILVCPILFHYSARNLSDHIEYELCK